MDQPHPGPSCAHEFEGFGRRLTSDDPIAGRAIFRSKATASRPIRGTTLQKRGPHLILADEPLAALDEARKAEALELRRGLEVHAIMKSVAVAPEEVGLV